MNILCLVVDRLHAGYLGALGNSWIETPHFDRLASQSLLFEQALVDCPQLDLLYRSYWHGWHAMCPQPPAADRPSLVELAGQQDMHTILMADDSEIAGLPLAQSFAHRVHLNPPRRKRVAKAVEGTHLAGCVAQLVEQIQTAQKPFFLWSHLASLGTVWDAPLDFRGQYVEEGDPEPDDSAAVPRFALGKNHDPDEVLRVVQAYAGQVTLLDACLGGLFEFLEESGRLSDTLLALISARGLPLGENGQVGPGDDALEGAVVQTPWLLRFPDGRGAAARTQALVEPCDLWATLGEVVGGAERLPSPSGRSLVPLAQDEVDQVRDRLGLLGRDGAWAFRTPAWYLRQGERSELFTKPDDRWEVNDVAQRCPEVLDGLHAAFAEWRERLASSELSDLTPLSQILITGPG
jgi:hypothetical protein